MSFGQFNKDLRNDIYRAEQGEGNDNTFRGAGGVGAERAVSRRPAASDLTMMHLYGQSRII